MANLQTYRQCQDYLYGRINYEKKPDVPYTKNFFKLDRMRELARRLGDPHQHLTLVHVAGTKGKGSTCAMLASMLTGAGYRTGLFTSPHLTRLEERFRIDGRPISPRRLVQLVQQVAPHVDQMETEGARRTCRATYFETITAMALVLFAQEAVDVAVMEVGLGGRLDSTNIITPRVAIITSISYDHMRQLGTRLASIAAEKAGIIKPGVPVVCGALRPTARAVVRRRCRQMGAPLYEIGRDLSVTYQAYPGTHDRPPRAAVTVRTWNRTWPRLRLPLVGRCQADNAALALGAVELLRAHGLEVSAEAAARGLAQVHWPGRLEVLGRRPWIIVDGAHNEASVGLLVQTLTAGFPSRRRILIFGTPADKAIRPMLRVLIPHFEWIVLTQSQNPRAAAAAELAAMARHVGHRHVLVEPNALQAYRLACTLAGPDDLILGTGSFLLVGELREAAKKDRGG